VVLLLHIHELDAALVVQDVAGRRLGAVATQVVPGCQEELRQVYGSLHFARVEILALVSGAAGKPQHVVDHEEVHRGGVEGRSAAALARPDQLAGLRIKGFALFLRGRQQDNVLAGHQDVPGIPAVGIRAGVGDAPQFFSRLERYGDQFGARMIEGTPALRRQRVRDDRLLRCAPECLAAAGIRRYHQAVFAYRHRFSARNPLQVH